MKRLTVGVSLVVLGAMIASAANEFPYVSPLTRRYSLSEAMPVASFETPTSVDAVNGGMQDAENVAVIECAVDNMLAIDEADWAEETASVDTMQAALSLKSVDDSLVWMGYFGGTTGWQPLTGTAAEGVCHLKIEIDYTLEQKKVRYSVKMGEASVFTVLMFNDKEWNVLGGSAAKVAGIDIYGYGTVKAASGDCGDRATLTTVATSEAFDMNYSNLVVTASATNVWGANKMTVTLKDGNTAVQSKVVDVVAGDNAPIEVLFDQAQAGKEYTYDVTFSGYSEAHGDVTKANAGTAMLFSNIGWFGFNGGAFENVKKTENISIDETKRTFSSVDDEIGTITPTEESHEDARTVVETVMTVAGVYSWTDLPTVDDTQLALALVEGQDNSGRTWAYKVGAGEWKAVTGSSIPTESGTYTVKVEFDYASATKTATVWVKQGAVNGDGTYVQLVGDDDFLLTTNKLNSAAVKGSEVNAMNATFATTKPVEVKPDENKHEIPVTANAEVDLANLKGEPGTVYTLTEQADKFHLRWKDVKTGDGKWAKINASGKLVMMAGVPANGLDSYASYVLGLDAEKKTDVPAAVVQPYVNQNEGIKLHIPNVVKANLPNSGYKVMFQVEKMVNNEWVNEGAPVEAGGAVSIPYEPGSQRYRVNTILK